VTRSSTEIAAVLELAAAGMSASEIARQTGIPRTTVGPWMAGGLPGRSPRRQRFFDCAICNGRPEALPQGPYAYLLGLYLGDGHLAAHPRGVYRLRIFCANAHPALQFECEQAILDVMGGKIGRVQERGCVAVSSYSKHWPCLFPQHGPGMKHNRRIILADWQDEIVKRLPAPLLRGLIHSDGCRVLNCVNGTPYPRYHFSNTSADIRKIFCEACDRLGIEWRQNNATNVSVARRASVARLDEFIGPKY
jgi:hypothetical protein